ncbi:MAG TPA: hypothetical protein PLW02_09870, partial [Verrucomicrobiota bacterium]|nr:hypothetical protein [Verrucomicrobiota bacterium]
MKKNNMFRALYASLLAVALTTAVSLLGETTNWVAINDHHRSTTLSSPYANFYNPLRDDAGLSGPLTNTVDYTVLAKGVPTPASIVITTNGGSSQAGSMGAPSPGTPAKDWFGAYVNFGTGSRDAIQLRGSSTITYTFNNLDPAKRYIFKGTASRAYGGGYANRWTMAALNGADSFAHAHTPKWTNGATFATYGVLTSNDVPAGNIAENQAAWCSGENTNGAMIVLTNINPGSDGSFSITVQTYKGTVPGGSSSGSYAYAFSAFSLEEIDISVPPTGITQNYVAINDYHPGPSSSPYANFYNPFGNDAGLTGKLTNTVDYTVLPKGIETPASIVITSNGTPTVANSMSGPNPGTPAGDWFRAYVDFGTTNRDAVQLSGTSSITYTFTGLDPSKRYTFKGTAARGASYADRWTVATIDSANSYIHSHKPTWAEASTSPNYGVLTANEVGTTNLAVNQAAWNSGENRAAGAMIVFSDIDPGPDGSFSIT